jgi:hypothetical protein
VSATPHDEYLVLLDTFVLARPTHSWVRFHRRRAAESGYRVSVRREGDHFKGAVVLKLSHPDGSAKVLGPVANAECKPLWMPVHARDWVSEWVAQRHLERLAAQDPDLWILEVQPEPLHQTG